jgi:hypothetical protein
MAKFKAKNGFVAPTAQRGNIPSAASERNTAWIRKGQRDGANTVNRSETKNGRLSQAPRSPKNTMKNILHKQNLSSQRISMFTTSQWTNSSHCFDATTGFCIVLNKKGD